MSTHNIHFHVKIPQNIFSQSYGRIPYGLNNVFESAMVNEPLVFESFNPCHAEPKYTLPLQTV